MTPAPAPKLAAPAENLEERLSPNRTYVREFFVDFFGSLVPGFLFVVIAALLLSWAGTLLLRSIGDLVGQTQFATNFVAWLEVIRFELLGLVLVASYVMGSLFYWQDPKVPDKESAELMLRGLSEADREKAAVRSSNDVQFPYIFLYEYLLVRGLADLAKRVPWKGSDESTHNKRTKMFINLLKIRLQFLVPSRCADLVRNEAHVRMMSSLWYASGSLKTVSVTALAFVGGAGAAMLIGYFFMSHKELNVTESFGILFASVGLYYFAHKTQGVIQRFFHYQRVREAVYVLEMADFAAKQGLQIFGDDPVRQ